MSSTAVRRWGRELGRFLAGSLVPALVLVALALVTGIVRTAALAAFAVIVGLRAAMTGLDRLAETAPTPRYRVTRMEASV